MKTTGLKIYREALKLAKSENPDLEEVYKLLLKSYELGNHKAAYAIGTWYLFGKHVKKSYKKAFQYLVFAIKGNLPEAYYDLAVCYELGKGTKINKRIAFLYYLKSALSGHIPAKEEVSRCYYYGIGVEKDIEVYNVWWNNEIVLLGDVDSISK